MRWWLLLLMLLLTSGSLQAKMSDDNLDALFHLSLEQILKISVTGSTLTPIELSKVPSAVTVFSHEQIKHMGVDTLDELMNLVPGFQSYRSALSGVSYPYSARGRRIGFPGAEVLMVLDGQRLDDPRTSGSAVLIPKIPLTQIQRVEFIRGPGSAVYGSNAMLGVVNIISRSNTNELNVAYGGLNRRKASLLASTEQEEITFDFFMQQDMDHGENYRLDNTFGLGKVITDDRRKLLNLQLVSHWQNSQFMLQHHEFNSENFYELDRVSNPYNARTGELSAISIKQKFNLWSASSFVWLGYTRTKAHSGGQFTPAGFYTNTSNPPSDEPVWGFADYNDYTESRIQWHNEWQIDDNRSSQFGLELRQIYTPRTLAHYNFDLPEILAGITPVTYYGQPRPNLLIQEPSKRDITGLYGQYQQTLFSHSHITLGLRYDHFFGIDSHVSPRIALVQTINEHHNIKFLYGEAFRAPAENELNLLNNIVLIGNPDLQAETVQSWDVIWMGQWPKLGFSLGYFENHYHDAITKVDLGGGIFKYDNVAQDPTKGIELELNQQVDTHLLISASYTHLLERPASSFREAASWASLLMNYQYRLINFNILATYHGTQQTPSGNSATNTLNEYWLLNSKIKYQHSANIKSYIQIKNLLDKAYLTPATGSSIIEGTPNRGREILTGISWEF